MEKNLFFTKIYVAILLVLAPLSLFAQEVNEVYIETTATIKNIEVVRSGRSVKSLATVTFTTEEGKDWETIIELQRIPFLGSFRSVGEELKIYYNQGNPSVAHTFIGQFISKYGMYLLILIGAIVSIWTYLKALKKSKKQTA